ncbi:AMP-binding protein [Mangrovihabitans endophyticus]|uniref:Amino acid adenylation protein n=1 Tax=Mangrovihabitans endophyticus TaxID=1751298 RepID=A0A8J3FLR0_9ACTN|nr:AMP-binding protein [Mangrovihabitans endophyticus]GGK78916.1 amino acid adenylation protein [Mangrovihabitans endophyticus]
MTTTIHHAVAAQAAWRPGAIAVVRGADRIDYATLDRAADTWAADLAAHGVSPGDVVPVVSPRTPALVAVLLAILKCGAAYAALDHRWPAARIASLTEAVQPPLIAGGQVPGTPTWPLPDESLHSAASRTPGPPAVRVGGHDPATVFFTSGTTGPPKGVLSPHQATIRLFGAPTFAAFGPGRAMPQAAPVPWDAYTLELWGMLTTGGTSVLGEGDNLFPGDLRDMISSAGVDTVWLTASLFNLFVDEDVDCFRGMRQVLTGGERLSVPHVRSFLWRHPDITLINGYGPVESCVFVTTRAVEPADCDLAGGIPIGSPVPGSGVHLLDGDKPVTDGDRGEICVSGRGLALRYLADERATAQKFVTVDVDGVPTRLYRTGDLGWRDDRGVLHFAGRKDRQVKIAGYRVEPGEVESAALRIAGIRECAVVPVQAADGSYGHLAMFYTAEPIESGAVEGTDARAVRRALGRLLPHYMVPQQIRRRDALPATPNGKLDRASLLRELR